MIHLILQVFSFNFTSVLCFSLLIFIILFLIYGKHKYIYKFINNNIYKKKYNIKFSKYNGYNLNQLNKRVNNSTHNKEDEYLLYKKKFLLNRKNKFLKRIKTKLFHNSLSKYNFKYKLNFYVCNVTKKKKTKLIHSLSNEKKKKKKMNIKFNNTNENNTTQVTLIDEKNAPSTIFNYDKNDEIKNMLVDLKEICDNLKIFVENNILKEQKKANLFVATNMKNEKLLKKEINTLSNNQELNCENINNCVHKKLDKENMILHKNEIESCICNLFKIYKEIELLKDINTYTYVCMLNEYCNFLLKFKVLDYLDICRNNNIANEVSTNLIQKVIIYVWGI
ncbi:hypothetical protein PGAL8A_00427100 [Plasmodium gallinaceum]|uniref:Uncharacterized protein n=1 Tax=Plasmodium gallinaceum TaxID=5849 RepID=A0A1J1GW77_PLAGA|nr:hypothetical protein PGAL8A_00427100 [Plasmodium gallinaceum]CRG96691.1 hypothetical protein PGAL8A_00427100 [Plasmodium gallinaceum]